MDLVKCKQIKEDIKNSWIMFDHFKHLKDWTTLAHHVYNSKYYKVLTIVCCNMQFKGGVGHIVFRKILKIVIVRNRVLNVNFRGFMVDNCAIQLDCGHVGIW